MEWIKNKKLIILIYLTIFVPGCGLLQRSSQISNSDEENAAAGLSESDETIEVFDETPGANRKHAPIEIVEPIASDRANQNRQTRPTFENDLIDRSLSPQQFQTEATAKTNEARQLFEQALREQNEAAFLAAYDHWKQFLARFPGMPGYEVASFNYALSLFHLGRPFESEEPLRGLIQSTADTQLAIEARLLLAEALLKGVDSRIAPQRTTEASAPASLLDEALALTFEILPDRRAEKRVGLERSAKAAGVSKVGGKPSLLQKIRIDLIRARIFSILGNIPEAHTSLDSALKQLDGPAKDQFSQQDMKVLLANWAWRRIEVLDLSCQHQNPVPQALSEAEFLAYADAYYSCIAPARRLYCSVKASKDQQIETQTLQSYRRMVERPIEIRDHLPPPARVIRKKEQRGFYESEMKALIEKTVKERSSTFRNIESCNAFDVF